MPVETKTCPNGHPNPADQAFCGTCGARISTDVDTPGPPAPRRSRKRWLWALALVILGGIGAAVAILILRSAPTQTIRGSIVTDVFIAACSPNCSTPADPTAPQGCFSTGGFTDVNAGTPVVVKDASGKIIGTGQLGEGHYTSSSGLIEEGTLCTFDFSVSVPDASFYSIEVSHRGVQSFSKSDLESVGWNVQLSLTSPS